MNFKEIAIRYFEFFPNKDINGLREMFAEDCSLRDWEVNVQGREEVLKVNQNIFNSVETIKVKPLNIYNEENIVIGDLLITINDKEELLVVDIITFDDKGKIKKVQAYKG